MSCEVVYFLASYPGPGVEPGGFGHVPMTCGFESCNCLEIFPSVANAGLLLLLESWTLLGTMHQLFHHSLASLYNKH